MKTFFSLLTAFLFASQVMAVTSFPGNATHSLESRATAATCGDPKKSITYFQGYVTSGSAHLLAPVGIFVQAINDAHPPDWQIQNSLFRAWDTQQPGTVQLFQLFNAANPDNMYLLAQNGVLPSAPGYAIQPGVIWVYPNQVCGSVPLFAMFRASSTDHYYSLDPTDPARMAAFGYVDQGIVAYVLPLDCGCN